MKILIINSGSSSLKYQLIDMHNEEVLAKGNCDRIGLDGMQKHESKDLGSFKVERKMDTHAQAAQVVIDTLTMGEYAVIRSVDEIGAVGHRIVQGGEFFTHPEIVTDEVIEKIEACHTLAPLHAYPNAAGIRSCKAIMPNVPQVVVFDTAFHQTMPKYAYMYGLPWKYYEKYKIRRYGFHGTSHKYVAQRAAEYLGRDLKELKLVTLHLGNGSSLCAIDGGKCIDTSMGLTPLEGPMMGTRCGSIDPAAVAVIIDKEKLSFSEINDLMNKQSGMAAISGVSNDFRDINDAADAGNEHAQLALDMFGYQCKKIMAGYIAAMGGVDAIVFTAGVGENRPETRANIVSGLEFMGIAIDSEKNKVMGGKDADITAAGMPVRTLVLATNEELMIARETLAMITN